MPSKELPTTLQNAEAMLQGGYAELALQLYKTAINARPNETQAYIGGAISAIEAARYDEALEITKRGLAVAKRTEKIDLESKRTKWILSQIQASALAELGQYVEAVRQARNAYQLNPCAEARIELASTLAIAGRLQEAEEQYGLALLETTSPELASITYGNMARVFEGHCEFDSALNFFRGAVSTDPTNSQARVDLARALGERGYHKEALAELDTIQTDDFYYSAAEIVRDRVGHGEDMLREIFGEDLVKLERQVNEGNQPAAAYKELADIYLGCKQTINAITALQTALQKDPDNLALVLFLADILVAKKLFPPLRALVSAALKRHPNQPQLHALNTLLAGIIHQRQETLDCYARTKALLDKTAVSEIAIEPWENTIDSNLILPSRRKCCEYLTLAFTTIHEWKFAIDCIFDLHKFIAESYEPPPTGIPQTNGKQRPFQNTRLDSDIVDRIRQSLIEQHTRCEQILLSLKPNPTNNRETTNAHSLVALIWFLLDEAELNTQYLIFGLEDEYEPSSTLIDSLNHCYPGSHDILDELTHLRTMHDPRHSDPNWACLRQPALDIIREEVRD